MIVALDISTADTGIAMKDSRGGMHLHSAAPLKSQHDYTKILHVARLISGLVMPLVVAGQDSRFRRDDECFIFVEQPFFVRGKSFPGPMYMLHGAVLSSLYDACLERHAAFAWNEVSVTTWRNWLLKKAGVAAEILPGNKRAKSAELKVATQHALVKLGHVRQECVGNSDIADAYGLLLWAEEQMKGE